MSVQKILNIFGNPVSQLCDLIQTWGFHEDLKTILLLNEDDDNKNIDIRLNLGSELIDAKYVSDNKALSKSTIQHQMFFYSFAQIAIHKNRQGRLPKRITLVYPVSDSGIEDPFELEETLFEPKNTDIKDLFEELYPHPSPNRFPPLRTFAVPTTRP